ncbi:FAD-dependent monooxygenase [Micromonospora sp. WMMA1923]|uniref:FAD-dependent monooxygenase n=1 Tax=Micromonospora sp. WMMA1923 TaxID=3404125 RepID=UPI003B94B0E3
MTGHPLDARVVVVGAGPVGLTVATELGLGGVEVTVLEQREQPSTESRASTVHSRTMELLDSRGLLAELGDVPNDRRGHFGGIGLELTLPGRYPGLWKIPQQRIEALLARRADALGVQLRRGWQLVDLVEEADHLTVLARTPHGTRRLRCGYLVACDGEQSTVRTLTAVDFPGRPARRELLRADVAGVQIRNRRFERLPQGLAIAARNADGTTRVMVHEFGARVTPSGTGPASDSGPASGGEPTFARVVDAWKRVTGEDLSGVTPLWVNAFGDANRQLTRYRHGRVFFAGDAAHQQMPAGGQAMNLGIQDAMNLGWKLARHLGPLPPVGLLDTYHTERHAVGARVLANIGAQASLLLGDADVEPMRELLTGLLGVEENRLRLAGTISGLDIRYDVDGGDHPLAGARLPELALTAASPDPAGPDGPAGPGGPGGPVGTAVTSTVLLRSGRGLFVDLTGGPGERAGRLCAPWADRVTVAVADPAPGGPLDAVAAALVRPDGYVAWVGSDDLGARFGSDDPGTRFGSDDPGARGALERWFGPPGRI